LKDLLCLNKGALIIITIVTPQDRVNFSNR